MIASSTYLHIPQLLNTSTLNQVGALLAQAQFEDGKLTAGQHAQVVKNNLQFDPTQENTKQQLEQLVMPYIMNNQLLKAAHFPKVIQAPLFSKYQPGMTYGWHTDSPVMGKGKAIRNDVAMTIFLSDPSEYEGGELLVQADAGTVSFKLAKGDAIVYPSHMFHKVNEIKSGQRLAAICWFQSMVRRAEHRETLFEMTQALDLLNKRDPTSKEAMLLHRIHGKLMRWWVDI